MTLEAGARSIIGVGKRDATPGMVTFTELLMLSHAFDRRI